MRHFLLFIFATLAVAIVCWHAPLHAQTASQSWESEDGPHGGIVTALGYAANGNLLAGTKHGGVYRSANNGNKWVLTNLTNVDVYDFARNSDGTMFAGTSEGFFRSFDNGNSWFKPNTDLGTMAVYALLVDNIGVLYAGTSAGVFLSRDNGNTWKISGTATTGMMVYDFAVDAANDIIAGTGNGVYKIDSSRTDWYSIGLPGYQVASILVTDSNTYLAGTRDSGVIRSFDQGNTWFFSGLPGITINTLIQSPAGVLFAGTSSFGIYTSMFDGLNWIPATIGNVSVFALNTRGLTEIQAGTGIGFYRSPDAGENWKQYNSGLNATYANAVAVDDAGTLFAATENQGLYRKRKNDESFIEADNSLPGGTFNTVAISAAGTVFAGHNTFGIFRSINHGDSWIGTDSGLTGSSVTHIVTHNQYIYAGTSDAGLFVSSDEGSRWVAINPPVGILSVTALGISPEGNIFVCYSGYGVHFSNDNGGTWNQRNNGFYSPSVQAFGFDSSGAVYAGTNSLGGLYVTNNNGVLWQTAGLDRPVTSMATTSTGAIFAGTAGSGVYKSTDGENWNSYSGGLPFNTVNHLTQTESGFLYASTKGGGVYRSAYRFFGSISGIKFIDRNRNRQRDTNEPGAAGWEIVLKPSTSNAIDSLTSDADTVVTDSTGAYEFDNLLDGTYTIYEIKQSGWVQTYPVGRRYYVLTIRDHEAFFDIDFGNVPAHSFTGTSGSNWSNPANWQEGRIPHDTDAVEIPVDVTYDQPGTDSIHSLRISSGGRILFSPTSGRLIINNRLEIDSNSTLFFDNNDSDAVLYCNGDWINEGQFNAGSSTIVFGGNNSKTISNTSQSVAAISKMKRTSSFAQGGQFYNLTISGDSTYTDGNIIVSNQLTLEKPLFLSADDTLSVLNDDVASILDTGSVAEGTIQRYINASGSGEYRFESPNTKLQFTAEGTKPTSVYMTAFPGNQPDTSTLWFERIGGIIDTVANTITVDSVEHFSKWVFGKPGTGFRKGKASTSNFARAYASREYTIEADGGSGFSTSLTLHYLDSELECSGCEEDLQLLRGPYIIDSVYNKWNLVSVPLAAENLNKDALFPGSVSSAFAYNGGYVTEENLSFGSGYWLKFNSDNQITILGDEIDSASIPVLEGWNLIGSVSLPVDPADVVSSPEGIITGSFYGYRDGYYITDALQPMHSYWVKTSSDGELILSASTEESPGKVSTVRNELSTLNTIVIHDAGGNKQTLYFGAALINPSRYDMPPVPPSGVFDARFSTNRLAESIEQERTKVIPLSLSSAQYPLTITWSLQQEEISSMLLVNGIETSMDNYGTLNVNDPSAQIALRLGGTPRTIPKQFALHQNFPNPFNPATTLSFDLPTDEIVDLRIYNILGQQVATLVENKPYKSGTHSLQLHTSGWASGVYFYRIQAGDFVQTKKMIVTK